MKTVLALLASLTLFTTIASAHPGCDTSRRIVGYTRCGDPIIATYEVVGSRRCGEPVYQWVTHYPRECRFHDSDRHDWDHDGDYHHHHHDCR